MSHTHITIPNHILNPMVTKIEGAGFPVPNLDNKQIPHRIGTHPKHRISRKNQKRTSKIDRISGEIVYGCEGGNKQSSSRHRRIADRAFTDRELEACLRDKDIPEETLPYTDQYAKEKANYIQYRICQEKGFCYQKDVEKLNLGYNSRRWILKQPRRVLSGETFTRFLSREQDPVPAY